MPVLLSRKTLAEIQARRAVYMENRLKVPITEEQYLWWDRIIAEHHNDAIKVYQRLLKRTSIISDTRCYSTGLDYVLKIKFRDVRVTAHRFTYAVHCSLPLSEKQVARHQCANFTCLNPAHIELGDQAQNFQDYVAARAYGIRRQLLPRNPLDTIG